MSRPDGTVDDVDPLAVLRATDVEPADQGHHWPSLGPDRWPARRLLAMVGALAVVASLGYWLLRTPAPPVESTLPVAADTVAGAPLAAGPEDTAPGQVVVHVAGAVRSPGVYELGRDQRVHHAVEAAGGASAGADLARINLASPVQDGARIYVPQHGEEPVPAVDGDVAAGGEATALVALNTASVTELETLPGVGTVTAAAIVAHRDQVGGFTIVDDLLDVQGIGEAKLEAIRPMVSL